MREVPLGNGRVALVDDADYERVSKIKWSLLPAPNTSYTRGRVNGKITSIHRFLLDPPKGMHVDHIDFDGLNNQRSNLRLVTRAENMLHRKKQDAGVHRKGNRWRARVQIGRKDGLNKYFRTKEEALAARAAFLAEILPTPGG